MTEEILLSIRHLETSAANGRSRFPVVDHLSLDIRSKEVVAIVGESGSGKTITAWSIMGILPEPAVKVVGGSILFEGRDLLTLAETEFQKIRGKDMAMIFQEPGSALNPTMSCGRQIAEVLTSHLRMSKTEAYRRTVEGMKEVGLTDAETLFHSYPHQLSGGMKQRILIAMALACNPKLLIADEPTSSLDVTVQAQILELIRQEQKKRGMAVLLITHDFGVVSQLADRVAVMYASRLVEAGPTQAILTAPRHPYTKGLLKSIPRLGVGAAKPLKGFIPELRALPPGCHFHPRCQWATAACRQQTPEWTDGPDEHGWACPEWEKISDGCN